ncbi:MAG: PKD domain-containing protein [Candidatus Marinimicrobia bacterium]|jgi:poly-gamma-glutamate capsule biosynthesis protein CapA/YwtB (metallophosphatase superfamily)/PKD repeat protein|nr:PKD domain-containing protein [Candidatus Neomarinimicrobiota bacterium]MBT3633422.1 PKD domain-containing protein [Candidatus Neomarinimicrobiota bacterium]MBT3681565.1 PKD domain-containing protein [Candidatus Neomarinimicrobiota bacterium]MBT3758468.1 PKD domain-containing protein [Candidatus Neomarinimicrobiota bacterium]MBT3894878.1 PKD domain-containing protein [Candidatus Neomarinimicrobiota bacterium]
MFFARRISLCISIVLSIISAEVIYETGSISEFIGGSSATTEYDNYVSHISEGIASPGYNDYGPEWLDVQSNGFGDYTIIDSDSEIITNWEQIFLSLIRLDIDTVDLMLTQSLDVYNYDIVEFTDSETQRVYYMLRERLDMSYFDENLPETQLDDVIGSFNNGWGLFIFNPEAARQNLVIEVPHPCDDFIAPYMGAEIFNQTDAFALMIAGAGREVEWTESGDYSNNKSKSDPARNTNTLFHIFHTVLSDSLLQLSPHSPLVLHVHSFDDNSSHEDFKSIVLSGGWDASYANKPIRDVTDDHLDFVNFTTEYPVSINQFGEHDALHVTDYYQAHYSGLFYYYGETQNYPITHTYTLLGPNTGVQMNYLHQRIHSGSVYEPWVQVELFEKPIMFTEMEMPNEELYPAMYPTSYQNYSILLDYFQPFVDAVQAYFVNWETVPDITPPDSVQNFQAVYDGYHYEELEWFPAEDTNFKSYRIFYDTGEITDESPYWDLNDDSDLQDIRTRTTTITNLDEDLDYVFKIDAIDYFDNIGPLSPSVSDTVANQSSHITIENFDDGTIDLGSYIGEDEDPDSWSLSTSITYLNSNYSLRLYGNTWKSEAIEPYPITEGNVWQISCRSQSEGEIHGFAVRDSINTLFYSLKGTELLDIEEWITVYQGYFPNYTWNIYRLPIADDWFARFEYYPEITELIFINDRDEDASSSVYFDEIVDITPILDISPNVSFTYNMGELMRNQDGSRDVDIQFYSSVDDPDSDDFDYHWQFGDGSISDEANPSHTFIVEDDHPYTVLLQVVDDSEHWGQFTAEISVDAGDSSFPLTLNFVGDIMLARRYENNGGIIETNGVESIFEPTLSLLGDAADVTIANLECPLTVNGTPHPTKTIKFKGHPDNVDGLVSAGIDIVTLANNHTIDYGLTGQRNTQNVLEDNDILFSGAGDNSYEAYLPLYYNQKGVNIAFLAASDRTGQYNNYQPYLNSGYNKPGFAYMTPYYVLQQIEEVEEIADLIVLEWHAGSEYSTAPGAGYDSWDSQEYLDPEMYNPPREIEYDWDIEDISDEDENYSPYLDVPHMWDREIRHFAIDSGADLVIIHHPHIIQGIEVYNGKVIAHSLGNYVFDLNYPETYPTMVFNTKIDETGFYEYSITPVYIDDYIPLPAEGGLGLHLLDYIAHKSRLLDTYLYVDYNTNQAMVIVDTLAMETTSIINRMAVNKSNDNPWISDPLAIHNTGNISSIESLPFASNVEFRTGRELIWFGNMENEGCTLWNINSDDEWYDSETSFLGDQSITHLRTPASGDNIVTNFEDRIKINNDLPHSLAGWIKTDNGDDVTVEIRFYSSRTSGNILSQESLTSGVDGDTDWTYYHQSLDVPGNAKYFDIRLNSDMPNSGEARSWFDNVSVIEWTDWFTNNETDYIFNPNEYYFLQYQGEDGLDELTTIFTETVYSTDLISPLPDFEVVIPGGLPPFTVPFENTSEGLIGWWEWDFGDGETSLEKSPSHIYETIGTYDVSLSVMDYNGELITEFKSSFIYVGDTSLPGDVNFDFAQNILDIVLIVNIITGEFPDPPDEVILAGDIDGDGYITVLDIVQLINIILAA